MTRTACSPLAGCHRCGQELPKRRRSWCSNACRNAHLADHYWGWARTEGLRRSPNCADCGKNGHEVHHIVPLVGDYGAWTCQHHQTNLRVLCEPCHGRVHRQIRAYMYEVDLAYRKAHPTPNERQNVRDQAKLAAWVNAEGIRA